MYDFSPSSRHLAGLKFRIPNPISCRAAAGIARKGELRP